MSKRTQGLSSARRAPTHLLITPTSPLICKPAPTSGTPAPQYQKLVSAKQLRRKRKNYKRLCKWSLSHGKNNSMNSIKCQVLPDVQFEQRCYLLHKNIRGGVCEPVLHVHAFMHLYCCINIDSDLSDLCHEFPRFRGSHQLILAFRPRLCPKPRSNVSLQTQSLGTGDDPALRHGCWASQHQRPRDKVVKYATTGIILSHHCKVKQNKTKRTLIKLTLDIFQVFSCWLSCWLKQKAFCGDSFSQCPAGVLWCIH